MSENCRGIFLIHTAVCSLSVTLPDLVNILQAQDEMQSWNFDLDIDVLITARCTLVQSAVLRSHVVCLSVRLSVTLMDCDHIGWNSSKIISPLLSLGCSIFATPTWRVCSKGNTPKFGPKVTHPCWFERRRHSIANCGRTVTDSATVTIESLYRKPPSLFRMVPSLTSYDI